MATIKSYSDLSQSKKLAEILPLESADMYWMHGKLDNVKQHPTPNIIGNDHDEPLWNDYDIPCWSLAALLDIIPKRIKDYNVLRIDINEKDTAIWYDEIGYGVNNDLPDITKETAIDACYEMIISLNELNLL